jgi:hypothetical protein
MQIIPIYDAAANADPSFQNDIQTAINILDAAFTAPITIRIDIEKGGFQGHSMSFYGYTQNTSLGDINENLATTISYATLRSDLINAVPGFFNNTNLPNVASINGHSTFAISSVEERIFGILPAITSSNEIDGYVGIGTGFSAGAVRIAAALHEIGHALGRVPDIIGGAPDILSLWRFPGPDTRVFSDTTGVAAYFSLDGGITRIADWGVWSDVSDFLNPQSDHTGLAPPYSNLTPNDLFNEFGGNLANLTATDKLIMEALGFATTPVATVTSAVSATTIQNDHFGIVRLTLPIDQATMIANAINAGTQTEADYVNGLLSQVANTTIPVVAVEGSMYGAVGSSAEVTFRATQFLTSQVANASKFGFNP